MNRHNVAKWCREFKLGKSDVRGEERNRWPCFITDETVLKIEETVHVHRLHV